MKKLLGIRSRGVNPGGAFSVRYALFTSLQEWRELSRQLPKALEALGA